MTQIFEHYPLPNIFHLGLLVTWLVSSIGMFYFVSFFRILFLIWIVISTLSVLVSGMNVMIPYDAFLSDAGIVFDGVILAMAYYSDASKKFK